MLTRRTHVALAIAASAHCALLFGLALSRFEQVHQRTFDLALYARAAWGLARGDFWAPLLDCHVFGTHLSPVLLPLGLLGMALGTVPTLLFAQALCVSLCVWPMARIGARRMGQRGVWLGALAWLLYPNLGHVATYEFHPGSLALLPMCWAFDALDRANLKDLAWCVVGMLACREDMALYGFMLGLALYGLHRDRRAFPLMAACAAYLGITAWLVTSYGPQSNGSLAQHYGVWGGSPLGVVPALFQEPERVWAHFREPKRLVYLVRVLAPLSFFSLRTPWFLLVALPCLGLNLLSAFGTAQAQYSHYLSAAVPAIVASGVAGLSATRARFVHVMAALALVISQVALGGLPLSRDFERAALVADAQTQAGKQVLAQIPTGASVQAPDALLPHLAERKVLQRAVSPDARADYVVLDLTHRQRFAQREDLLRTQEEPRVRSMLASDDHALLVYAPPYALLSRGRAARESPVYARYRLPALAGVGEATRLSACLSLQAARLDDAQLTLDFEVHGECPPDLALRLGLSPRPTRVDLLFDGALSPSQLRQGDVVRSRHALSSSELAGIRAQGLCVGLLRSSGAPPEPRDPICAPVSLLN